MKTPNNGIHLAPDAISNGTSFLPSSALARLDDGSMFNFNRWKRLFRRNLWLIVLIVGASLAGAAYFVQKQPKIYASRAVLQVEQQEPKVLNKIESVSADKLDSDDYLKTVVELLTSNSLMLDVVKANGLERDRTFAPAKLNGAPYLESELAAKMLRKLNVSLRRGTRLIDIVAEDRDPQLASRLANSVVDQFLKQTYEENSAVARQASEFLLQQANHLKGKLEISEQKLQQYKEDHQAVSLEERQNITVAKLKEISTQVNNARSERIRLEADLGELRLSGRNDIGSLLQVGSVASLPQVAEIRTQLGHAKADFAALANRYGKLHPKYIAAANQIGELSRALSESVQKSGEILTRQYQAASDMEGKLNIALKDQEEEALKLNRLSIPYNVLFREEEADRVLYDNVVTRLKETSVTQGLEQVPYRIAETAMVPSLPSKPEKLKMLVAAFFGGSALAVGLVLMRDLADTSLHSSEEAENYLGLRALATIPERRERGTPIAFADNPTSQQSEAFRSLRASLAPMGEDQPHLCLAVTSALALEGKSYTSLNVAVAFARQGLRTLVIDADLRRPQVSELINGKEKRGAPGLSDYLSSFAIKEQVVHPTGIENLFLLPAGPRVSNPAELLTHPEFVTLLGRLREEFARIVIDTAPVNVVSDTLAFVAQADAVCLVVRGGRTPRKTVQTARDQVHKAGGRLCGFVLNRISPEGIAFHPYQYPEERREKKNGKGNLVASTE